MKRVFVSHINEEAPLALVLRDWLESSFPDLCEVFVSTDPSCLPVGAKWLDHIDRALEEAVVLVVLCSSRSLPRPWINFEAGCAWRQRIAIIPICHSGVTPKTLPAPLREFQALDLGSGGFAENLIRGIGKHLGLRTYPRIDFARMTKALLEAEQEVQILVSHPPTAERPRLEQGSRALLGLIVAGPDEGVLESDLRATGDWDGANFRYHVERLQDGGWILGRRGASGLWYWPTPEGRRLVFVGEE